MSDAGLHRRPRRPLPLRLLAVLARATPLVLTVGVLTVAVEKGHALEEAVHAAESSPAWLHSFATLAMNVLWPIAFLAVIAGGFALTAWVSDALSDAQPAGQVTQEAPSPEVSDVGDEKDPTEHTYEGSHARSPAWPLHAARGVGIVLLGWGLLQLVGVPWRVANHGRAQMLYEQGASVEATAVRVEVDRPWWSDALFAEPEVRHVEVRLPAVADGEWVNLTGVVSPMLHGTDAGTRFELGGWEPGSHALGYGTPLAVLYVVDDDGEIHAMARQDVLTWRETGVQVQPVLPLVGLLLICASAAPGAAARWRSRTPGSAR